MCCDWIGEGGAGWYRGGACQRLDPQRLALCGGYIESGQRGGEGPGLTGTVPALVRVIVTVTTTVTFQASVTVTVIAYFEVDDGEVLLRHSWYTHQSGCE